MSDGGMDGLRAADPRLRCALEVICERGCTPARARTFYHSAFESTMRRNLLNGVYGLA